jgi:spore coat protein H
MRSPLIIILPLAACSPPGVSGPVLPTEDTGADTVPDPDTGETGQEPSDTGDTGSEWIPGKTAYELSDHLFQLDLVHQVEIELGDEGYRALSAEPYEYVSATVTIDGEVLEEVGARVKGRLGSYRELYEKAAFKIDFNRYIEGQLFHGLEKLNLNNMVQDSSQVHERIGYALYGLAGVPAPRVGYAWLRVNGQDFGLYTMVEAYDDVFLEGRFEDPSGNLYDGDYVLWGGSSYSLVDFDPSVHDLFDLDEGEDVKHADIHAITRVLLEEGGGQGFDEAAAAVLDVDAFARMWAADAWVGHYDSYSYNRNNYRVYFDPEDGLADLFPWDPDWAFYSATPIASPSGLLAQACKADSSCHRSFHEHLAELCTAVEGSDLEEQLDDAIVLIREYVAADPRKEASAASMAGGQEDVRRWLEGRRATLESTGGL